MKWNEVKNHGYNLSKGDIVVETVAFIRKNNGVDAGVVREMKDEAVLKVKQDIPNTFMWTEGNYCCDCNRDIFWNWEGGKDTSDDDYDCSYGEYSVNLYNPKDNKYYYKEFDKE